jgi:amino acid adenylation domain-containing protein
VIHQTAGQLLEELKALDVRLRVEDGRLRINAPKGSLTPALEAALIAQKDQLVAALQDQATGAGRAALAPVTRSGPLRLSFLQERLWVLDQLQPGQTTYNLATTSPETDGIDAPQLLSAIRRVVERHEILRTRFVLEGSSPRVRIVSADQTRVELRDLRALGPEARHAAVMRAAPDASHEPFNLAAEAPVRFAVLQTGDARCALLISAHHIALDSWSLAVLLREVLIEYQSLAGLSTAARPPLPLQYVDYAHWQREASVGDGAEARLRYWTDRLASLPQLSTFPTDRPRPVDVPGTGTSYDFAWSPTLSADVRAMARDLDSTLYMVLLAAVAVVLTRNSAQTDVAIGSPLGTRDLAELEGMLGPILNPLVLRFDLGDDPTFATLVHRARDGVLDGHANQDVPFETLVQALNPQRSLAHSPLFQVAAVLHNAPDAGETPPIHSGGAIYDLTVFAVERQGALVGSIEYRSDLYDETSIARLSTELQTVLRAAARDHHTKVSVIPLLAESEALALVAAMNPAPVAIDRATIVEQFARTAGANAGRIAAVATDGEFTYAEIDRRASLVADALRAAGAGRGSFVALATDRSSALVVGALGILKSGAAYVPIDVSYPADRVAFMLSDSGARHVVATRESMRTLHDVTSQASVVLVEDVISGSAPTASGSAAVAVGADDIAYLMYTSGSTGTPKGVLVPHGAVTSLLGAMCVRPGITPDDAVLCVTSMSFDISVLEVFLPLVSGARTIVASRADASDGQRLADLIRSSQATIVQSTPSGWRLLMQAKWSGGPDISAIAGGEPMPHDLTNWLGERVRWVWNGYGPTETTVYSSMALLTGADMITIGTPVANTRIYILDAANHVLPIGAPGEICIGGDGVTRGYHNRPELTAERFVEDPFNPGARMYRTGDYGRWRTDGRLEHLGRIDGQVKLRGYRIETGEIETALSQHPAVHAAVVGVRHAAVDDPRLVAWVRLEPEGDCTTSELRRYLRETLPEFMIPSMFLMVESFPLTPNAKIDKRALPDPFANGKVSSREYVAPTTSTEQLIAGIWIRLLGAPQVGTTDSFFELGGHSLLAMRAAQEISDATGVRIEPRLLFFRTLGQLAAACDPLSSSGVVRS